MTRLLPGEIFAGYRIVRRLGAGGMGTVYVAEHPRLPRLDAIKILAPELATDPEFRARFQREAELAARIDHPNVVAVRDRGVEGDLAWIAMQYVEGQDAAALLRAQGPLSPERAVRIITEAAAGLDAVHQAGLLHRDVKPPNILLSTDGAVRITDFGIARPAESGTALTRTGTILASIAYAAPEQFEGGAIDHRADVYALGATLYELLTGTAPFAGRAPAAIMAAHLSAPPPRPSTAGGHLPVAMDEVIARAMAKNPRERYSSCAELADAARRASVEGLPPSSMNNPVPQPNTSVISRGGPIPVPGEGSSGAGIGLGGRVNPRGGQVFPSERTHATFGTGSSSGSAQTIGGVGNRALQRPGGATTHPARGGRPGPASGSSRLMLIGGGLAAVVLIAVVIAIAVRFGAFGSGRAIPSDTATAAPVTTSAVATEPSTGRFSATVTTTAQGSAAWGPVAYIVDTFPGLLPATPDGTGYQGLRCDLGESDARRLHCPSEQGFSVNIWCDPGRTPQTYSADPGLADVHEQRWTRTSGTGTVRWASDSYSGFGLLSVAFDDPGRDFCVVTASGGSGAADVYDNWWTHAPI
ncbi:serine/threonine-protein kinase [Nocardia nova]|nr:serine/threonine-protein kinase [Nocardia nova]